MIRREWRQAVLFFLPGLGLLAWAHGILPPEKRTEFHSNALLSAAFVLIAVALLQFVYWLAAGDPTAARLERLGKDLITSFDILKDARVTGLQRILGTSRDFASYVRIQC